MICANSKGQSWTSPETAENLETSVEQIIASKLKVQYLGFCKNSVQFSL